MRCKAKWRGELTGLEPAGGVKPLPWAVADVQSVTASKCSKRAQ